MPETKIGECPWCGNERPLFFVIAGRDRDEIWADWICGVCLNQARQAAMMVPEGTEPSE